MNNTAQNSIINLFSIALLTNTFFWSNYHFGIKSGNYLLLSAFFLFAVAINIIATNKSRAGSKNLLIIILLPGSFSLPFLGNTTFLTLHLSVIALLSGFLFTTEKSLRSVATIAGYILIACLLSYLLPARSLIVLTLILSLLAAGSITVTKIKLVLFSQYLLIVVVTIFCSLEMFNKTFFEDEPIFKGEIIFQDTVKDSTYTLTHTKGDWLLFQDKNQVLSSADYFMLFESITYSAFQYHPQAQNILVVSPYVIFFLEELNKYPEKNIAWLNQEKEKSELIRRIVRKGVPEEVKFDVLLNENVKFDIIILNKNSPPDRYVNMLNLNGLIVKTLENQTSRKAPENFVSKDFHIALPTTGEHFWEIYSRDSLSINKASTQELKKTDWFNAEVMDLITNSGKYY